MSLKYFDNYFLKMLQGNILSEVCHQYIKQLLYTSKKKLNLILALVSTHFNNFDT